MDINLEHYKVFKAVAEKLSFSAAANSLFITQPAVSQTITALEKSLGTKLFIRNSKGVTLTLEGEHMYNYVDTALNLIKTGENKLNEILNLDYGEITIAVADTISKHYLLPYLREFNGIFPKVKIKVINRTSGDSISLVRSAVADIAFVNLPIKKLNGLVVQKCMEIHDIFVASNKYDFLKGKFLSAEEIANHPLILLEKISNSRKYIDDYFVRNSVKIEPEIELGSHDLLLEFAKINLGISCVIKEFSAQYLDSGELFEIIPKQKIKSRHIGMVYSQKMPLTKAAEEFIKCLKINGEN